MLQSCRLGRQRTLLYQTYNWERSIRFHNQVLWDLRKPQGILLLRSSFVAALPTFLAFFWVLGIETQALLLAEQEPYPPLSHLPSSLHFDSTNLAVMKRGSGFPPKILSPPPVSLFVFLVLEQWLCLLMPSQSLYLCLACLLHLSFPSLSIFTLSLSFLSFSLWYNKCVPGNSLRRHIWRIFWFLRHSLVTCLLFWKTLNDWRLVVL